MTIQVFSNNAKSTLASAITNTQTTITVSPGTGSQFPNPITGQQFKITLISATSSLVYEICNCTARTTDTLTVIRGQEGTTAQPFSLNDIVGHFDTAAVMTDLVQTEQLQGGTYSFATATGIANAISVTIPSNLTTVPNGMNITVVSAYANTAATTLTLTLGTTTQTAVNIVKGNNVALSGGEIPAAGFPMSLTYSNVYGTWLLNNPATPSTITANGYTRLSNGLIMQWGNATVTGGGNETNVTLPIAWPTGFLSGSVNFVAGSIPTTGCLGISPSATVPLTAIQIQNTAGTTSTTNGVYWTALGY